jgi:hypothetical protein
MTTARTISKCACVCYDAARASLVETTGKSTQRTTPLPVVPMRLACNILYFSTSTIGEILPRVNKIMKGTRPQSFAGLPPVSPPQSARSIRYCRQDGCTRAGWCGASRKSGDWPFRGEVTSAAHPARPDHHPPSSLVKKLLRRSADRTRSISSGLTSTASPRIFIPAQSTRMSRRHDGWLLPQRTRGRR